MKKLLKFRRNKDGVTAIEFAIIAPLFFLIFLGIIEVGLTMFVDSTMNTALRAAARKGVPDGYASAQDVRNVMEPYMGGIYADADSGMVITVVSIPPTAVDATGRVSLSASNAELDRLRQVSEDFSVRIADQFGNQDNFSPSIDDQSGAITIYAARYEWGGFTKLVGMFLPDYLYATAIVRNEVFEP